MSQNLPTFESAYARLEEILQKMNSGKTPLEESLQLYEEADNLISFCSSTLIHAEKKIEKLIKSREAKLELDSEGKPLTEPFTPFGKE